MSEVPDYSGLEPQWQLDWYNWNTDITAINGRRPALSNPPIFLKLFNNGYDTYEDLKADLDKATSAAGWLAVKQNSKPKHAILACSRGAQRQSTATQSNASTIKAGCKWAAVAHATKKTSDKWKLVIHEHRHTCHGPQEVPEAQRGWVKLSAEHHEFLIQAARDPTNATPSGLARALRGQFKDIQLGPNTLKNWLQNFHKDQQGMYTSTQAALEWLKNKGFWYTFAQNRKGNITGVFWCKVTQMAWL